MTRTPGNAGRPDDIRLCFVMLLALGHAAVYQNLRATMAEVEGVDAHWVPTRLWVDGGVLERSRGVPSLVRASLRALQDVRRGLREHPSDVLIVNPQNVAAFCQWYLARIPTILMLDATPVQQDAAAEQYGHAVDAASAVRRAKHAANLLNFRLARALVPQTAWAGESLARDYGIPREKVHVITPGVAVERWRPRHGDEPMPETPRLLFVGGDFARKGGPLLVDVFRRLGLRERAELHMVTGADVPVGPGIVAHRGLRPNAPELLALYRTATAVVLPSLADFSPVVCVEAAASGVPVVATRVGGVPHLVEHARTGLLVEPGDGRALGAALVRLLDDPTLAASLGRRARERALRDFDARTNARRLADLARSIARRPRPAASGAGPPAS